MMDGLLGPAALTRDVPGLSAERPLSASALRVLLACPQRFLLERILGLWARTDAPSVHRIDATAYGRLFHRVAEAFSREHGPSFGAREHDLEHWRACADAIACAVFEAFLDEYPLVGDAVIEVERARLRRDVRTFIGHDWNEGHPRAFVAVEREFGNEVPLALSTPAGPLFIAGRIDRIDVEGSLTLVRDLKTGRALPRERELYDPDVAIDLQLAVYVAVARRLASEWDVPSDVAGSYVYVDPLASQRERGFRTDRLTLHAAGGRWLDLAGSLLREQAFVRTTDAADCLRCPFSAVCGDSTSETAEQLREASGVLAAFRDLKR